MVLDIYTDASLKDGRGSISMFTIDGDEQERSTAKIVDIEKLKQKFDYYEFEDGLSIYFLEMYSVYEAVKCFSKEKNQKIYDVINIYTDRNDVFDIVNKLGKVKKRKDTINMVIFQMAEYIKSKMSENLTVNWIESHCGVYGNEIANKLAYNLIK